MPVVFFDTVTADPLSHIIRGVIMKLQTVKSCLSNTKTCGKIW